MMIRVLSCLLVTLLAKATQASPGDAKLQIDSYWNSTQDELRGALGKVRWFVLQLPLSKLKDLADSGRKDIDKIYAFKGPGDKDIAYQSSVQFWKEKMQEVIRPYVENPYPYQGRVTDPAFVPEDPRWNTTDAYKRVEQEIVAEVEKASVKLTEEMGKATTPRARAANEVTEDTWREHKSNVALSYSVKGIQISGQWAKVDAAIGKHESGMAKFRQVIEDTQKHFKQRLQEINA